MTPKVHQVQGSSAQGISSNHITSAPIRLTPNKHSTKPPPPIDFDLYTVSERLYRGERKKKLYLFHNTTQNTTNFHIFTSLNTAETSSEDTCMYMFCVVCGAKWVMFVLSTKQCSTRRRQMVIIT